MQINLNTSQQNFPILSPIFQHTPILSPLREETLRKYSYNYEELGNFRLESCQDEDYLLFEIQELQQEYHPSECQIKQPISEKKILQPIIEEKVQEQKKQDQKQKPAEKIESEIRNQLNQDSEKDQSQEREYYCQPATELQKLIQYLIQNVNKDQQRIKQEAVKHSQNKETFLKIIPMLLKKFKKTKKTKEQMVKYCMRKSFKYVADKMKQNRTHNRDIDSCMRMYFSKNQTNFSIPFKKNSTQKTMNGSFLKRIFSSSTFVADYKDFLGQFDRLIHQDNFKKIRYLAEFVDTYIKTNEIQKVQSIKRLPWTEDMLQHTLQLSKTLLEYGDKDSPVFTAKRKCE